MQTQHTAHSILKYHKLLLKICITQFLIKNILHILILNNLNTYKANIKIISKKIILKTNNWLWASKKPPLCYALIP